MTKTNKQQAAASISKKVEKPTASEIKFQDG